MVDLIWGLALSAQAKMKTGDEADRLFALAGEKYQAVLAIKPEDHGVLNNWGAALMEQAKIKTDAEADQLFAEAKEKLLKYNSQQTNYVCHYRKEQTSHLRRRVL